MSGVISVIGEKDYKIYNFAGDEFVDLENVIEIVCKKLSKNINIIENDHLNPSIRMVSNISAKKQLDWRPNISIDDGVQMVIDFFIKQKHELF